MTSRHLCWFIIYRHVYLALDACQAAGTSLWVTEESAVTAAVLAWDSDSPQLVLLLYVNLLDTRRTKQGPAFLCGQGLKEEVFIHLCVVQVQVILRDIIHCESIGLFWLNRTIFSQLETEKQFTVKLLHIPVVVHWLLETLSSRAFVLMESVSYPEFDGVEFFLFQVVSQHVPVYALLFLGKLAECVLPYRAVSTWHAQGAASLTGHAGKALPPAEIIHCHLLEMHPLSSHPLLSLQDGGGWRRKRIKYSHYSKYKKKNQGKNGFQKRWTPKNWNLWRRCHRNERSDRELFVNTTHFGIYFFCTFFSPCEWMVL